MRCQFYRRNLLFVQCLSQGVNAQIVQILGGGGFGIGHTVCFNHSITLGEGRVYGGGLRKLEPGELANVDASEIAALIPEFKQVLSGEQLVLFGG